MELNVYLKAEKDHPEYGRFWRSDRTGVIYDFESWKEEEPEHDDYTEVKPVIDELGGLTFVERK